MNDARWRELIHDAERGHMTLFLGAGISIARGVPPWGKLVHAVCRALDHRPKKSAWLGFDDPDEAQAPSTPPHPLAYQVMLEEIEERLRAAHKHDDNPVEAARTAFAQLLGRELYAGVCDGKDDSMAALVDVLRLDQQRATRRIVRVVTLNADDLLETEANRGHDAARDPVVWPVARASHHPRRDAGAHGQPPIPIYHVHGYLPQGRRRGASDALVFTDAQYWESVASPSSFANRVVANALHDSHCVFIGMSMTDVNVMRWLGVHFTEVQADKLSQYEAEGRVARTAPRAIQRNLRRHFWVRRPSDDDSGFVGRHLLRRGVVSVTVDDWAASFGDLLRRAFG